MPATSAENTRSLIDNVDKNSNEPLGLIKAQELAGKGNAFEFTFQYMDFLFAVKAQGEGDRTKMQIHANLGYVPYTVEGITRRVTAMDILGAATEHMGGRVKISPQQRIMLYEDFDFDEPLTPVLILTKVTMLMLRAKPFLTLMSRVIDPPMKQKTDVAA